MVKTLKIDHRESIEDFGNQFDTDNKFSGYLASKEIFADIVHPFNIKDIENKNIMEVGSGSGRIIKMLLQLLPKSIVSVEPSKAINIAKKNNVSNIVEFKNIKGEELKYKSKFDYVFSLGVIHHIPNYQLVCKNIYNSLNDGGKFICWVYGYEGNELYLFIFNNLRRITIMLPDFILRILTNILNIIAYPYLFLCKIFPMPLKKYFLEIFGKCNYLNRNYIIFDQLNPSYAKYFKKEEFYELLKNSGFNKINLHHRHGYSWTAICQK